MRKLVAFGALVALVGGSSGSHASATAPVATLASFAGSLEAVAQDGARVAWLHGDGKAESCDTVTIQNLSARGSTTITQSNSHISDLAACANVGNAGDLALAGSRVLWSSLAWGNSQYLTVWSGSRAQPAGRAILYSTYNGRDGGAQYRGMAGSAATLVYAVTDWKATDACRNYEQNGGSCSAIRQPSPIRRVDQEGGTHDVTSSDAGDAIAASGDFVATVRGAHIVVLKTATGARVGAVTITSCAPFVLCSTSERSPGLALGPTMVAIASGSAIQVYDWHTHHLIRRVRLDHPPSRISLSGNLLVWGTSNADECRSARGGGCSFFPRPSCNQVCAVWVLNLSTGRRFVAARPRLGPFDVTIVGRRITWGENEYRTKNDELQPVHGYVRVLRLPSN
jgi:hypothetical protein